MYGREGEIFKDTSGIKLKENGIEEDLWAMWCKAAEKYWSLLIDFNNKSFTKRF